MRTVISVSEPNGTVKLSSAKNHQAAHVLHDPFFWIIPSEPEGSLLFLPIETVANIAQLDEEEAIPSTLKSPPSSLTLKDSIPDSRIRFI